MKTKIVLAILIAFFLFEHIAQAQIIALTVLTIARSLQPADKRIMTKIKRDWIVKEAKIDGRDVFSEFEGVRVTFKKCDKKEDASRGC